MGTVRLRNSPAAFKAEILHFVQDDKQIVQDDKQGFGQGRMATGDDDGTRCRRGRCAGMRDYRRDGQIVGEISTQCEEEE